MTDAKLTIKKLKSPKRQIAKLELRNTKHLIEHVESSDLYPSEDNCPTELSREIKWRYGTHEDSREKTRERIRRGHVKKSLVKKTEEIRTKFEAENPEFFSGRGVTNKRKRRHSDTGDELSMTRLMTGDAEHWSAPQRGAQNRVVTLGIEVAMSCGNKQDDWVNLIAHATLIADMLTTRGFGTRIVAMATSTGCHQKYSESSVAWELKNETEPLDIRRVQAMANLGVFRDYVFSVWHNSFDSTTMSGLGVARQTSTDMREFVGVDYVIGNRWGEDKLQSLVIDILRDLA